MIKRWQQNVLLLLIVSTVLYIFFLKTENRATFHRHIGNACYTLASFFGERGIVAEKRYNATIAP